MRYGLANNRVRNVSVTLWFRLQPRCKTFCFVCFYQSALCKQCVFVLRTSCQLEKKFIQKKS